MTINNNVVKMGPWRKQYDHKQQCCEKGGHDENNMTINNNVVKKGTWRKQYEHKQQGLSHYRNISSRSVVKEKYIFFLLGS
jgi:hypothetical protein